MDQTRYAQSISLPDDNVAFRNVTRAKRFAIDIGGTLTKLAYYSTVSYRKAVYNPKECDKQNSECQYEEGERPRLHFVKFESKYMETCLEFIRQHLTPCIGGKIIKVTGGGAYKYKELLQQKLGLEVDKEDELSCVIKGCNFVLKNISDEVFSYQRRGEPPYRFKLGDPNIFPYLLVNIGSGVSIMKVESEEKFERIGGTATGGGTFAGLGCLLTNAESFDDLLHLAEQGDHRNVDMLVGDIYGGDYKSHGLPGDLIAASFGKVANFLGDFEITKSEKEYSKSDVVRSLLYTISNDIGQISCLYADKHQLNKIYIGGHFTRGHPLVMHTLSYAINFWSKGKLQPLFLRHEGYLTAIGAFLKGGEECDPEKYSWAENYAGSSGLGTTPVVITHQDKIKLKVDQFEIDRWDSQLVFCPLLKSPLEYVPDSVDLTKDPEARTYWLECFEGGIEQFVHRAIESQPTSPDAPARAAKFRDKYLSRLNHLKKHPCAYGNLTVRSLLDMRDHCLNEADFPDPYLQQKKMENEKAMACLRERLDALDDIVDKRALNECLVAGLLVGNVFDWGAQESAKRMHDSSFGFIDASKLLKVRPWLIDDVDSWLNRLEEPNPHRCVLIFVDNSGADIVVGVLPFARELLKRGSQVILCANSRPVLNDITYDELKKLIHESAAICPIIAQALVSRTLVIADSGQSSPCLDLSRVSASLAELMVSRGVDLIVLEGMGRAVHTNLDAKFTCEVLKAAVIKNKWLARRLGGDTFAGMCRYERP